LLSATGNRKSSIAQSQQPQPQLRQLNAADERRYGASTHDRLTSGVSFGADKLMKMRQAKSNVQTQKIASILGTLGFPEIIPLPTARVGTAFEGLVAKIGKLLDVRKVREKEEAEVRVLEGMKARLKGEDPSTSSNSQKGRASTETQERDMKQEERDESMMDQSVADSTANETTYADGEGDEDDVDGEVEMDEDAEGDAETAASSTRQVSEAVSSRAANTPAASVKAGHKRSASVLSGASSKSLKRTRK